jgi:hypothetical protein
VAHKNVRRFLVSHFVVESDLIAVIIIHVSIIGPTFIEDCTTVVGDLTVSNYPCYYCIFPY